MRQLATPATSLCANIWVNRTHRSLIESLPHSAVESREYSRYIVVNYEKFTISWMILRCAVHRSGVPMQRLVVRSIIIGAAVALSGCVTDSTVDLIAADPDFTPKAQIGSAPMPTFQVGDIFRYKVGNILVAERVERIDSDGVWWRDNLGRRWFRPARSRGPTARHKLSMRKSSPPAICFRSLSARRSRSGRAVRIG